MARFVSYLMLLMFLVMTEEIHGGNSRSELVDVPAEEQLSVLQKEVTNLQKEVDQLDRSKIQEVKREIEEWEEKYIQSRDEGVTLQDELYKLVIKNSNLHQGMSRFEGSRIGKIDEEHTVHIGLNAIVKIEDEAKSKPSLFSKINFEKQTKELGFVGYFGL